MSRKTRKSGEVIIYLCYGPVHSLQPDFWGGDVLLEVDVDHNTDDLHERVFTLTWRHSTQVSPLMIGEKLLEIDWLTAAAGAIVPQVSAALQRLGYIESYAHNRAEALRAAINPDLSYKHSEEWRRVADGWNNRNTRSDPMSQARAWRSILHEFGAPIATMSPRPPLPEGGKLTEWERNLLQ